MDITITEEYETSISNCKTQIERYSSLINRYSVLRLIVIALGIFLFYQSLKFDGFWLPVCIFFVTIVVFSILVRQQNIFEKKRSYFSDLTKVYENEIGSVDNRDNMYDNGSSWIDDTHPYTSDLDIFGKGSLFELVNRSATVLGVRTLAGWLNKRSFPEIIRGRQEAIQEISEKRNWKHNFQALLLFSNKAKEDHVGKLFQYLRSAPDASSRITRFYIRWIPLFFFLAAVSAWFFSAGLILILGLGITNLLLMQHYNVRVMKTDALVGKMSTILDHFSETINAVKAEDWNSPLCIQLASAFKNDQQERLPEQIKQLSVLIKQLALGLSPIGPALNFTIALNVRQFFAIEEWKKSNKVNLEEAFDVIANYEALISLSSLRNNYPAWCFPAIIESENFTLSAKNIGHPLISVKSRVANDYSLNDDLKIDIITGSNMAGKSTFLRTLGINIVLGLSGAPVCAEKMDVSPMLVFSYMRIRDSLNESTSTFKAELDRLQNLLQILKEEKKVYFLIDEMLRGTNSVDKYLGSKAVIEKLISQKAVGIIATHDLQIAELEQKYPDYIRNFYFDIEIIGSEMMFDYKLKDGECKTFNASILLKRLGIFPEE